MVSLIDIVDVKHTVTIRGKEIEVEGINAEKLGTLIAAYPDLRLAFAGKGVDLKPEDIVTMGPLIVASVIAWGTGAAPTDKAAEDAAAKLTIGEQITLLTKIFEVTFPDGFGPFVEKLRSLGLIEGAGGAVSGWGPGTNSHKPPSPSPAPEATAESKPS